MKKFILFLSLFFALALPAWSQTPVALDTIWTLKKIGFGTIQSVIFSNDGSKIYHTLGNKIQIRNTSDGSLIKTIKCSENEDEDLIQVAATPDDRYIITSSDTGLVKLWDAQTGQMILKYPIDTTNQLIGKMSYRASNKFAITKDSKYVIVPYLHAELENPNDPTNWHYYSSYFVYELLTSKIIQKVFHYKYPINTFVVSNSTGVIAVGSNKLQFMDPYTFVISDTLIGEQHLAGIPDMNFSPDGKLIATAGGDGYIKVWDVEKRKLITSFLQNKKLDLVQAVKFSYNGQNLYSTGKLMIKQAPSLFLLSTRILPPRFSIMR